MAFNGSGTFLSNSAGLPVVTSTVISSTMFTAAMADIATGLSTCITKDNQTATTARISFALGINSTLTTDATNTITGSILTAGGVGIAKALWVGGLANIAGALTVQSTLAVTGAVTLTAPLTVSNGGTGVATLAANGVLYGNGAGVALVTAQGAANSVLTANAGAPSFSATPTITALTVTASVTVGSTLNANGGVAISSGSLIQGWLSTRSVEGLCIVSKTGSGQDFSLFSPAVSPILSVPTGSLDLNLFGKLVTYNNIVTAGLGVPAIYKSGRSTAQTAAVASVAAYTNAAADGSFLISANVNVTTSTTHSFTVTVAYTDETNTARTLTLSFFALAGGAPISSITNVTGAGPYEGARVHIRCKASTAITIATTGTFTTVTYNVEGYITQIG